MSARRWLSLVLAALVGGLCLSSECARAVLPSGTVFIDNDIFTEQDPTSFTGLTDAGRGTRVMFDRRTNEFETVANAYLFRAAFADHAPVEMQVNPEIGTLADARSQAEIYATVIGRLPRVVRADVDKVWIQGGTELYGGGNRSLLIHIGQTADYLQRGVLEEVLFHEATHTSFDARHASAPKWLAAQRADPDFISQYAKDNPTREDVAETFLLYYALRYRRARISDSLAGSIEALIPQRIAYFDQEIAIPQPPLFPTRTVIASGSLVQEIGTNSAIPTDAVWSSFGVPAINDARQVAFTGKWTQAKSSGTALVSLVSPAQGSTTDRRIVVATGSGSGVDGAVFSALGDPLLAKDGAIAFLAKLKNAQGAPPVSGSEDEGLWLETMGTLTLVEREGGDADQVPGARWQSFTSVALSERVVAFTATLRAGSSAVPANRDQGLWVHDRAAHTTRLALREGDTTFGSPVKVIAALAPRTGSLGQGRGAVDLTAGQASTVVRITLLDGTQRLITVDAIGAVEVAYDGATDATLFNSTTPPKWKGFGLPTQDQTGGLAFLGQVRPMAKVSTATSDTALFVESAGGTERVIVEDDLAPGAEPARFAGFADPVNASGGATAFLGTLRTERAANVTAANALGLWSRPANGALGLRARAGDPAPDTPVGVVFKKITSVCLPEGSRGPCFTATLANRSATLPLGKAHRVGAANQKGLWSTDATGQVRLLARTGQQAPDGGTLQDLLIFAAVPGSSGQTRSYNANGECIYVGSSSGGQRSIAIVTAP